MGIDFLVASAGAARRLQAARTRHARLQSQADARLAFAQGRHREDTRAAADIEAKAWMALLAIPGMTVASASEITRTSPAAVRRWIAVATQRPPKAGQPVTASAGGGASCT